MKRWVAVSLKVPDNTAFTTLLALHRLGAAVSHVDRARLVQVEGRDEAAIVQSVERDEELFNVNLHHVSLLTDESPSAGEVWVWPRDARSEVTRWRLRDEHGRPLDLAALRHACDALLCNRAIEDAELPS